MFFATQSSSLFILHHFQRFVKNFFHFFFQTYFDVFQPISRLQLNQFSTFSPSCQALFSSDHCFSFI